MWYKNMGATFFRFVTNHAFDRQTDRRTDRQTAFSSLDRSAVETSIRSCLFLLSSTVRSFKQYNVSSYVFSSMLLIIFVNFLWTSALIVFYIMWIPSTNTIFNMRPNKCFIQTQHYPGVLKSYCPFYHTQYSSGLVKGIHTLLTISR